MTDRIAGMPSQGDEQENFKQEELRQWTEDLSRERDDVMRRREIFAGRHTLPDEGKNRTPGSAQGMSEDDIIGRYVVLNLTVQEGSDSILLWTHEGIAVVMGCDVALIGETLKKIRESRECPQALRDRIAACRCDDPQHGELYDDRIFDILMDGQVEEHLQVHIFPRREPRLPTLEDAESIRSFWERLKAARSSKKREDQ